MNKGERSKIYDEIEADSELNFWMRVEWGRRLNNLFTHLNRSLEYRNQPQHYLLTADIDLSFLAPRLPLTQDDIAIMKTKSPFDNVVFKQRRKRLRNSSSNQDPRIGNLHTNASSVEEELRGPPAKKQKAELEGDHQIQPMILTNYEQRINETEELPAFQLSGEHQTYQETIYPENTPQEQIGNQQQQMQLSGEQQTFQLMYPVYIPQEQIGQTTNNNRNNTVAEMYEEVAKSLTSQQQDNMLVGFGIWLQTQKIKFGVYENI